MYKEFGAHPITPQKGQPQITLNNQKYIDFILKSYSLYSASELSKTTHLESPWKDTADGAVISNDVMVSYYSKHTFAKNFPLGSSDVYYPPKTSSHYTFSFDMNEDVVPMYSDIDAFVSSFKNTQEVLIKLFMKKAAETH